MCERLGGKPERAMKVKGVGRRPRWDPQGAPSTDLDFSERFE